jgi:hypothetical protein
MAHVVKHDDSVDEHEESSGDRKDVGLRINTRRNARLKIAHTIVPNIAHRAASKGREYHAGHSQGARLGEGALENPQWVLLRSPFVSAANDQIPRASANEGVAGHALAALDGL